jgi:fermentation-respiration switch protein FrsA (DUF1100 family)
LPAVRNLGRVLVAFGAFVLSLWAAAVIVLWAAEPRIVYRASWTRTETARFEPPFTPLRLPTTDNLQLDAVALEHHGGTLASDRYWIVYFNGAAGSIYRRRYQGHLRQLHESGYNVFSLDYRGFGRSAGTPTERGLYADAASAYQYLTVTRHIPESRVILAGRSLGSAVAIELATRVSPAGLLLLSPIDSVPLVGARLYPWAPVGLLASSRFDSINKIDRVQAPVLIVHASAGQVCADRGRTRLVRAS